MSSLVHTAQAAMLHATMRIETSDPRWCEHLAVGASWDVHAYDDAASLLG